MERDPSIHVTKLQFEKILETLEISNFPTEAFFMIARKLAINSRVLVASSKKTQKKADVILRASKGDAALVSNLIYAIRVKLHHRGVKKVTEANARDWTNCKKLAEVCNIFCNDFGLDTREGFLEYINIGFSRMDGSRNILQRLISMQENITDQYASQLELKEDDNKDSTRIIHDYFVRKVANTTGIYEDLQTQPSKYVHFLRMRKFLKSRKWDYREFIDAQFESLLWCNGLPEPSQMYGDKAIERYNKYLYKKHASQETPQVEGSLWSRIKS